MTAALSGVRVLDLTNVLAGPFCAYQLGLLGADVVKVEVPESGDLARQLGADAELNKKKMGASFLAQNGGKKSLTLNLKSDAGKEVLLRLVRTADVLVENFRPGPVLVNVPMDFFSREIDPALFERVSRHTRALNKPSIDDETARQIVQALLDAEAPVIQAGGGVILADAAEELKAFVDHMGIPVAHSLMGKGVLRDPCRCPPRLAAGWRGQPARLGRHRADGPDHRRLGWHAGAIARRAGAYRHAARHPQVPLPAH